MHISKEIAHYFAAVLFLFRQKLPSRLLPNIFRRLDSSFIAFFFSATASFTSTVSNIWPPATGTSLPISFWISFRYGTSSTSQKEKAIPLRPARPVRPIRRLMPNWNPVSMRKMVDIDTAGGDIGRDQDTERMILKTG